MFCWDTLGAGIDVDATRHTLTAQTLVPQQEKVPRVEMHTPTARDQNSEALLPEPKQQTFQRCALEVDFHFYPSQ